MSDLYINNKKVIGIKPPGSDTIIPLTGKRLRGISFLMVRKLPYWKLITKDDFRTLLGTVPEISFQILKLTTERLRATNAHLKELEASTNQMEDVIRVITNIARKSNLLSLNASIEAARVGEAGRAFSVVATEMKRLAEDSAQEANKIDSLLQALQSKTKAIANMK